MKLFFYIFGRYCRYALAISALCVFLFIFFDFSHRAATIFMKIDPDMNDIVRLYCYQLPVFIVQALPIAALLASVITMSILGHGNEITAMRAAGASQYFLAAPLLVGGFCLSLTGFIIGNHIVPVSAGKAYNLLGDMTGKSVSSKKHGWLKSANLIFYFQNYDPQQKTLTGVEQIRMNADFRVEEIITAARAVFQPPTSWLLEEAHIQLYDRDGLLKTTQRKKTVILSLPLDPASLRKESRKPLEMNIKELLALIKHRERIGEDTLSPKIDLHLKVAYPAAAFFGVLIGLRFGFLYRRSLIRGVLITFAAGLGYWLILGTSRALGRAGDVDPLIAVWLANAVFFVYSCWELLTVQRRN